MTQPITYTSKSAYNIEQYAHRSWHIVERATTRRGFAAGKDNRVVLAAYRDLERAKLARRKLVELNK